MKEKINKLQAKIREFKNASGYIRYLSKKIDRNEDVFINKDLSDFDIKDIPLEIVIFEELKDKKVSYKAVLVNSEYLIDIEELSEEDLSENNRNNIDIFYSVFDDLKVKMLQVWKKEVDPFLGFEMEKLQKVVFVGFEGVKK